MVGLYKVNYQIGEEMDKALLREIIRDFEGVSKIVNSRLEQLRSMLGETHNRSMVAGDSRSEIKESIEKQRNDMMQKIEEMRRQAMSQVQESVGNYSAPGMPGMGMNQMPMSPIDITKMKQEILNKIETEKSNRIVEDADDSG